jgi:tRNA-Thr(GGU) m(6)t(6)A37 methyltransferase TsaA
MPDLRPIGAVRSPVAERKAMPPWGVPACVEVFPEFAAGLLRIEKHSHLWILGWFDRGEHEREVLQVTPRGAAGSGPEGLHGVFAVRSPARPNPIGLTAARVAGREGNRLHLDRLDFLDGTPVADIKPYFITRDLIYSASGGQIGRPRSREELRDSLSAQAEHFHGGLPPGAALAVRIVEHFRVTRHGMNDPAAWNIAAPLARPALVDALMGMTRVSPGRGTLAFHAADAVVFDGAVGYAPAPRPPASSAGILAAPDEELFTVSAWPPPL